LIRMLIKYRLTFKYIIHYILVKIKFNVGPAPANN
jgi:hypothetical protein